MMRLPRLLPSLTFACALSAPLALSPAFAQETQATTTPAAPAAPASPAPRAALVPVTPELSHAAEDFWHYASIARYELAKAEADKIVAMNADPMAVLNAFEAVVNDKNSRVSSDRRMDLYERMLSWQRVPEIKDSSAALLTIFNKAKLTRRADPKFIEQNIARLSVNSRAYALAMEQLRQSGELAVPIMLAQLADPSKQPQYIFIRSALRDLGIKALNPLLAATEMKETQRLLWVCSALGDIGYDNAVPYLVRLAQGKDTPAVVQSAAREALLRLNVANPEKLNAAQLFYELGEKFYYEKTSIQADPGSKTAMMWFWSGRNLSMKEVPAPVFNEDMALRCCEYALSLDASRSDAVSLWLAAAYKRQVELPEGAVDPLWDANHASPHFYASDAGTRHLNPALARAMRDHDNAVALLAIKSLQAIAGSANLFADESDKPLLDAMRFPDRQVRFEAAFTIAMALPQKAFTGQDRVAPILAEALAQTGKPGVLIVASSQDQLGALKEKLGSSYNVAGAVGVDAAVGTASELPGIDIIIANEADKLDRLFSEVRDNVRLAGAGVLVKVTSEAASPYAALAAANPMINVTAAGNDDIAKAVEVARKRSGGLPIDEKVATSYALRSAELLGKLAICRGQVLDLGVVEPVLLKALNDARPEVIKAAGLVLAATDTKAAQDGLLIKALDAKTPDEMKIDMFKDLSANAKLFQNKLDEASIDALTKFVSAAKNPEVRSAAAEAHGALNLPAEQVKTLILEQRQK